MICPMQSAHRHPNREEIEMGIEYLYTEGAQIKHAPIKVKLDGRICGEIRKVGGGYQYYPKGARYSEPGEIFPSVKLVKRDLEM